MAKAASKGRTSAGSSATAPKGKGKAASAAAASAGTAAGSSKKRKAPLTSNADDLIMTVDSDDDDVPDLDEVDGAAEALAEEEEEERARRQEEVLLQKNYGEESSASEASEAEQSDAEEADGMVSGKGRKKVIPARLADREKIVESRSASSTSALASASANKKRKLAQQLAQNAQGDLDPDFQFDLTGDGYGYGAALAGASSSGDWDMGGFSGKAKGQHAQQAQQQQLAPLMSVDDIIAKRRDARKDKPLPLLFGGAEAGADEEEEDSDDAEDGGENEWEGIEDVEGSDEEDEGELVIVEAFRQYSGIRRTLLTTDPSSNPPTEDGFGAGLRKRKAQDAAAAGADAGDDLDAESDEDDEDEEEDVEEGDEDSVGSDPLASDDEEEEDEDEEEEEEAENSSDDDDEEKETAVSKARNAAFFASAEEEAELTASLQGQRQKKQQQQQKGGADASPEESVSFQSLDLSRSLLRALASLSFHTPTPIQARTIPLALAGKDLVANAVTGSGKTAAFMIPILERLLHLAGASGKKSSSNEARTRVLILTPTRELAIQCQAVGRALAKFTDIRFCLCVGGLSLKTQEAELRLGPEVVIATPGRLIDHVRNTAGFTLDDIEVLVMDEADRMLEDGFKDELNEIVKSCPQATGGATGRQTMLFSATMTDDVDELVRLSLRKPVRLFVDPKRTTAAKLIQEFVRVRGSSGSLKEKREEEEKLRPALLLALCTRTFTNQVIIFVRSKKLAHHLRIIFGLVGLNAAELHGDLSQDQRLASLQAFKDGRVDFLLATDLASRGLDIRGVQTVINYDMPGQFEQYLHRVGRTARAGRSGRAVTLVGEADRKMLKVALKKSTPDQVKHRLVPSEVQQQALQTLEQLHDEAEEVMQDEKEEKALRQAEMELKKGENINEHRDEIYSRPARTWFQSEAEKAQAKQAGTQENNAKVKAPEKTGKDRFAGLSRKKRRSKMMREEVEREGKGAQREVDAAIRSAKRAQKPTDLGRPVPKFETKMKQKAREKKKRSSASKVNVGKGKSGFASDLGERRGASSSGGAAGGKKASAGGSKHSKGPAKGAKKGKR